MRSLPLLLSVALLIPAKAADQKVDLEVTRVAIFNSGVAYYECQATVDGNATAELDFRTEQVNDILKSLMVQDLDGGRVGVVRYASQDPIEKTLKSFGVDITGKPSLAELLDQLRGQPVEITGERRINGVIVGVEQKSVQVGDTIVVEQQLNVLTDSGIQQLPVSNLGGIRLTDQKVADELQKALATLARSNDASKKSVQLSFEGSGQRRVRVAYLLEAPIWKTSYRLALDDEGVPFLQGWATVENATEEDWNDVRLSLVSGRPISFRMDLYTPIYIPRPVEELELYASLRPPEYAAGTYLGTAVAELAPAPAAMAGRAGGMVPGSALRKAGRGYNTFGGGQDDDDEMGYQPADWSGRNASVASVADAADAGELFQYSIAAPVALPRQQSAMLPIVNEQIEGRKVSIYNPNTHIKHPLNGLELTNASDLHLMQGPVTLFEGSVYAGDAKLPDMQPKEKRLIAYALDLATEVTVRQKSSPYQMIAVKVVNGTLVRTDKHIDEREYVVKNKSDRTRAVLIEQPWTDDWKLITPSKAYEETPNLLRFDLDVPAAESVTLPVRLERVGDQTMALSNLSDDRVQYFIRSRVISPAVRQALERLVQMKAVLARATSDRSAAERANAEATREQARIRENLNTLRNTSDAYKRQIDKFERLEIEIEESRERVQQLQQAERQAQRAVDDFLRNLSVE